MMSLGDLVFKCTTLENEIDVIRAEIWVQGGSVFGTHRFASEDAPMSLIVKLHPGEMGWRHSPMHLLYFSMTKRRIHQLILTRC